MQLSEADSQWGEWEANKNTDRSLLYMIMDDELYFRVATKCMMNHRTSSTRQNRAHALIKAVKRRTRA